MNWTPYDIEIILHHHCSAAPIERQEAPAYWPAVKRLFDLGILRRDDTQSPLETADLGKALVELWCATPLPVIRYVDPRFDGGADVAA